MQDLQGTADALGFFEAVALSGLEDCWLRLPVPTQRHFFSDNLFGGKAVKVQPDGVVVVFWTVCFGQDWERVELRYDQCKRQFCYSNGQAWNRRNV